MFETTTTAATATAADVRTWAKESGRTDVGERGKIAQSVKDAFTAATGRLVQ